MNTDARSLGGLKGTAALACPACKHPKTGVRDTRLRQEGITVRRRACNKCGHKFTTEERIVDMSLSVRTKEDIFVEITKVMQQLDELRHEVGIAPAAPIDWKDWNHGQEE